MSMDLPQTSAPTKPVSPQSGKSLIWNHLHGCSDSLALASTVSKNDFPILIITPDQHTALRIEHELTFFLGSNKQVNYFPDWETLPYDMFSPLPEIISQRLNTLASLPRLNQGVVVTSIQTVMQKVAPRDYILPISFALKIGDKLDIETMRQQLEKVGYLCVSQVFQHGEFAVRGSIIDLYPMGCDTPFRIELFDDEIESIRTFDPQNQLSQKKVEHIQLFPTREFPFTDDSIKVFRQSFRTTFPQASNQNPIYQSVSKGIAPGGIEYYWPLFVDNTETLFDYLPPQTLVVLMDTCTRAATEFYQEIENRYQQRKHDTTRPVLSPDQLYLDPDTFIRKTKKFSQIIISETPPDQRPYITYNTHNLPDLSFKPRQKQPAQALSTFLDSCSGKTLFVAETAGHREGMLENLKKYNIKPKAVDSWQAFLDLDTPLSIVVAPMDHGLWMQDPDIVIITESQLSGERAQQRRRRRQSTNQDLENMIHNLAELEVGSPVIHQDHGVGRYQGLQKLEVGNIETEFLMIIYADDAKLYLPVASLHLINRYSGASPENAPLHKLGGEQWGKAKRKAIERIRDVAAELLEIHSKRAAKQGFACKLDEQAYNAFADAFPFEETPDQETAIHHVIADMTSGQPMDRVICGDVGFGKTEVCMRAAFIAVQNDKQVAILVPTTLLAQQHFQNFRDRFADWPFRIEVLSRFFTPNQQTTIIYDVLAGKVDILIGTHKLVKKSIQYKNLGLVVIDEEQRFGVRHKEHFKQLRAEVDILTLTATPIPRTLNMALSGLRDVSIIATPPPNRHTIQTAISEWNDEIIKEACQREINRGGQIFFLQNDVKSMERIARDLHTLVPNAQIEIAHGQMPERTLERIMLDFYHQRFNLLVSTTIIESGIDIPSANTIILNRADKHGLAQLHQLRGLVGRSHHRAYAHMLVPPKKLMTKDAIKRLEAIEAASELGAGFMLASQDMEIRGAGELLGDDQSGQMHEIGFSLYTELLERAVAALKSGKQPELDTPMDNGPEVDFQVSSLIPDDYLPDIHTRLVLYKRIANAKDSQQLRDLQIEMIDRFGLLPEASKNLFAITETKLIASPMGITKIEAGPNGGRVLFQIQPNINPEKLIELIQTRPGTYKLDGPTKLRFVKDFEGVDAKINFITELLNTLAIKPTH